MFAGTDESPGEVVVVNGERYKEYRGMGSVGAMKSRSFSKDRYFQEHVDDADKLVPEGIEGRVPYKGAVRHTVFQIEGGLRQAMGYCGAATIDDMQTATRFVRMTGAGLRAIRTTSGSPKRRRTTGAAADAHLAAVGHAGRAGAAIRCRRTGARPGGVPRHRWAAPALRRAHCADFAAETGIGRSAHRAVARRRAPTARLAPRPRRRPRRRAGPGRCRRRRRRHRCGDDEDARVLHGRRTRSRR
ncbi:MAG: IMP dehydrogenase [Acidimicrobiales bacterium]